MAMMTRCAQQSLSKKFTVCHMLNSFCRLDVAQLPEFRKKLVDKGHAIDCRQS
jgi:hypothetical protein